MNDYITIKRDSIKDEWLWKYLNEIGVKSAYDLNGIAERVCSIYDITLDELKSSSKKDLFVQARGLFIFISYSVVKCGSSIEIGEFINRDHSTVIHFLNHSFYNAMKRSSFKMNLERIILNQFPSFLKDCNRELKRKYLNPIEDGTR